MMCKQCAGTGKIHFVLLGNGITPKLISTDIECGKCKGKKKIGFKAKQK